MRKLTLDPESLRVESFRTASTPNLRGTVNAARADVIPHPPAADTGCTEPCMSNASECPILSCGSDCDPQTGVEIGHVDAWR
jgi:hypothetical protein